MVYRHLVLAGLSAGLLLGCASSGYEDPYQDPQVISAFGLEEEDLSNRPSILNELFGRMRDAPETVDDERLAELEAAVERLEQERAQERFEGLRHGVGLLMAGDEEARVNAAFERAATTQPALILRSDATRQALTDADCDPADLACADSLAVYPGLRLVIQLSIDEDGHARWRATDTVLGWQGREHELQLPMNEDGDVPDIALESLADRALRSALERTESAPWQARVFSDDDTLAINAGRAHGLQRGDRLSVTTTGRVLRGPAGQPAGWLPGDAVGEVEVDSLAGERVATVRVLNGERPGPEHILIKE